MAEQMIAVGGYRLSIKFTGTGTPPVVLLAAAGGAHEMWDSIAPQIAELSTCVTYGRAGLGGSDPLPNAAKQPPGDFGPAADELRALLHNAGVRPPYVFLTGSLGGFLADRYLQTWPDEVAGVVLLDPTGYQPWPPEITGLRDVTDEAEGTGHRYDWRTVEAEYTRPRPPSAVPTVVVSAAPDRWQRWPPQIEFWPPLTLADIDRLWQGYQRDWARLLSSAHIVTHDAGHFVHNFAPQLVLDVVAAVLEAARRGDTTVELATETVSAAGGDLIRQQTRGG